MSDKVREHSGLEGLIRPGRHGRTTGAPGVTLRLCPPRAMASVIARKGGLDAATAVAKARFGIELPTTPQRIARAGVAFAWAGPGQWLASSEVEPPANFERTLREALGATASVIDQSAGRLIFALSGPDARNTLAKAIPLDLHPSDFAAGATASTLAGHIGVQLWLLDDGVTFELCVARSYAQSLWRFLSDSAAEFGVEII